MEKYDVVVVGAGPAGSATAIFAAKKGYKVLLVDKEKFPRDKICGDGISGKSIEMIKKMGLLSELLKLPHKQSKGVIFSSPKGDVLDVEVPKNVLSGFVCRRRDFDNFLFQNAKKLVDTLENHAAVGLIWDKDQVVGVKLRDKETNEVKDVYANIIVGADGARGIVAKEVGQDKTDDRHLVVAMRQYYEGVKGMKDKIEIHFVDEVLPGYFWIFPLDNGQANVGVGMLAHDQKKKKVNLSKMIDVAINSKAFKDRFKDAKPLEKKKGWMLPLGSKRRKGYANGVLLVGDACSLIDPFTGEGIGNGTHSAYLASEAIDLAHKQNDFTANTLKYYDELLKKNIDPDLKTMYRLQRLGRFKFLINMMIKKASKNQALRNVLTSTIIDAYNVESKRKLLSPVFWIKVLLS